MAITRTQLGQQQIYNGGLVPSPQAGGGRKINNAAANLGKANDYAKKHRLVTKGRAVTDALGLTKFIDNKTGGVYSDVTNYAKTKGYGKKNRRSRKK